MRIKSAILQVTHPHSLESLVHMFQAVGIECLLPNDACRSELLRCGCDTVVDVDRFYQAWDIEPRYRLNTVPPGALRRRDTLYVDIKAHRNGPRLWRYYPNLEANTLWYRINGGRPCNVPGKGDEINPPCPVLTPDRWFSRLGQPEVPQATLNKSYSFWPPFVRWEDFQTARRPHESPVCLVHNVSGWGYNELGDHLSAPAGPIRLRRYGGYGSPDGLLSYKEVPRTLSEALCLVHLQGQDCPGYALYEAIASACPVVVSRCFTGRWCMAGELFVEGETCLCFDRDYADGERAVDFPACAREAEGAIERLQDRELNQQIGEAARVRLSNIMWGRYPDYDHASLRSFLERMYP